MTHVLALLGDYKRTTKAALATALLLSIFYPAWSASGAPPTQQLRWAVIQLSRAGGVEYRLEDGRHSVVLSTGPNNYEHWSLERTADLAGDGGNDAIVEHFTGGAHCCFEYLIASSKSDGIVILDTFSLGDAEIQDVVDLDGDNIPEITSIDNRFAYFPGLSFAASPFLPLILCRSVSGLYYDCTSRFPSYLQASADQFEQTLREYVKVVPIVKTAGSPELS